MGDLTRSLVPPAQVTAMKRNLTQWKSRSTAMSSRSTPALSASTSRARCFDRSRRVGPRRAGAVQEQPPASLMALFSHQTSRESDPELHTHASISNLASRRDGSLARVSRELYKAQKQAGATYRKTLQKKMAAFQRRRRLPQSAAGSPVPPTRSCPPDLPNIETSHKLHVEP